MHDKALAMIVSIGFFSSLCGCSNGGGHADGDVRYVTENSFKENLTKQTVMSPQTVAQLRKYGVTDDTTLKLEFFFYTDAVGKARALATSLRELSYEVGTDVTAGDDQLFLVTGWTIPIKMDEHSVVAWTEKMCRLGLEHDCAFDGWGTNAKQ